MESSNASQPAEETALASSIDSHLSRRGFMARAAVMGLSAGAFSAFLSACAKVEEASPTPTGLPTRFPTPTPFRPAPTLTALSSMPTATVLQRATPTGAPSPTPSPPPIPPVRLVTEAQKISHLLRRAGFGAKAEELARYRELGLAGTIDHLVNYETVADSRLEARLAAQTLDLEERLAHLQRWWLQRMLYTERPLQEKMVLFWHGLLTSEFRKVGKGPAMLEQNQLYRANALGRFDELIKAVSRDPAMLIYLDSRTNRKEAPNENYARELMELFTLGIGHYTEDDVREAARAFTGWHVRRNQFRFQESAHDFGAKTFLGKTGDWDGDDVIDIIMEHEAAGEYIARRLWEFFAYADPEPQIVNRLAAIFRANGTAIKPVVRAIFESDEFYSERAVHARVKGPAELVATALRSLGVETDAAALPKITAGMGQELFQPPNVAGWDGGIAWLNSSTLLERINFANLVATSRGGRVSFNTASSAREYEPEAPQKLVEDLTDLLLGGLAAPDLKQVLIAFLLLLEEAEAASGARRPDNDGKVRAAVYLILASPDFQLA